MSKAIVLGATGFIGSHVARALVEEGLDVRALTRSSKPSLALEGLKVERVTGDLNDLNSLKRAFQGCDYLFHVAGYYPIYSNHFDRQENLALAQMENVLAAAESVHFKRIVYTSSLSTIGREPSGKPSTEETAYETRHFTGLYYQIKFLQEAAALTAADQGLPVVMVNPTGVFGDYDVKPTSGALVIAIAKKQLPFLFDAKCNVVDARDVAKGQIAAMKKGKVGRRYILGSHNTTSWEMARTIARIAKVRPPYARLPLAIGEIAAHASEFVGRLFRQDKPLIPLVGIDFLKYGMHYDTSRAKSELGFMSRPIEETFERALAWFKKHRYI